MSELSIAVIVPAYNEEEGLPATLESLLRQTIQAKQIFVVDDGSTDQTAEVAVGYGVTVLSPPHNLGSKARAQNYALPWCDTDLVLAVDADTVLADGYIEEILPVFEDPNVVVAAGCVQTRFEKTWTERGRSIEYLFGFHWNRPIQNKANSVVVCSGCCSVFRLSTLVEHGGFPERTIVEDMDYTWWMQTVGHRAVYVGEAVAWAADPSNLTYLRKQLKRWMAGFFQNVRIHSWAMIRRKPMLAAWVLLAVWEIITAPLWWLTPVLIIAFTDTSVAATLGFWIGVETCLTLPPLIYGARRRRIAIRRVLLNVPFVYLIKMVNIYYAWRALVVEMVMVPIGLTRGLVVYEKGRAQASTHIAVESLSGAGCATTTAKTGRDT